MRRLIHAKVSPHTFAPDGSRGFVRLGSVEDDADGRGQVRKRWVQAARFRLPRPGPAVCASVATDGIRHLYLTQALSPSVGEAGRLLAGLQGLPAAVSTTTRK